MAAPDDKRYLDDPANVRRLWIAFCVACGLIAAVDLLAMAGVGYHRHVSLFLEGLPGFYPLWGFLAISVLITLAKGLRRLVQRPEDYYDAD